MSIERGRVVGVLVGAVDSARPGIVLDVQERQGNIEPLLLVAVAYETTDGGPATVAQLKDVPHVDDSPDAHWRWNYGGPELLVRKPLAEPPTAPDASSSAVAGSITPPEGTPIDPAAGAGAPS